jgi:hypothetical protein
MGAATSHGRSDEDRLHQRPHSRRSDRLVLLVGERKFAKGQIVAFAAAPWAASAEGRRQRRQTGSGGQSQLTVGEKTWLCKVPKLPPILWPPPEAQIRPCTKADP